MDINDIDFEKLREDLYESSMAAAFGGGFGGALFEAEDVERASEADLIRLAQQSGVNLANYISEQNLFD